MFFDSLSDARAYAKALTADMRGRKHKAIACTQWRFDRLTGEYESVACYTVVLA